MSGGRKYDFYNADLKHKYLNEVAVRLNENSIEQWFSVLSLPRESEEMLEKDVSDFTLQEIINLFEQKNWISPSTFKQRKSIISSYTEWVKGESAGQSPIYLLKNSDLKGVSGLLTGSFEDLEDLKEYLNYVYDNSGEYDISKYNMHKAVWYLIWHGFTRDEISLLKKTDVDTEKRVIYSSSSDYVVENIDEDMSNLFAIVKESDGFEVESNGKIYFKKYNINDFFIRLAMKGVQNNPDPVDIVPALSRIGKTLRKEEEEIPLSDNFFKKTVNYTSVYSSGVYDRLYKKESEGFDVTADNYKVIAQVARTGDGEERIVGDKRYVYDLQARNVYNNYLKWKEFYGK